MAGEAAVQGLLWAFEIGPDGAARALSAEEAGGRPEAPGAWRWMHLDGGSEEAAAWLRGPAGLPVRAAAALLAEDTRPRSAALGEGRLVILRGVDIDEAAQPRDMVAMRLWTDDARILSLTLRPMGAAEELREEAEAGELPGARGRFLALLAERLAEDVEPVLDMLEERFAALEEKALAAPGEEAPDPEAMSDALAELRRMAIPLSRFVGPQREAMVEMRRAGEALLDAADRESLAETGDRLQRHVEDLAALRERAQALSEQIASDAMERTNRAMYMLSLVSVLFLPLGFLTGLLGVNLGGIPGAGNELGFWAFVGLLAVVAALEVWLIRRARLL
ncbi:MAG: CorA family divalent cation transporter [Pseudomonadota bacterium]